MNENKPPVKLGDIVELECISIGKMGDGIFKHEGFVIISSGATVGNTYKMKITRILPRIAFAELI
jgi:predicted RNA-binding protein with TRAM domain